MSPHNVNNFVSDLVLMAKAMEELPIAQERIKELEAHIDHANETIQSRELSILSYKEDIAKLQGKLNASEVARDDAELRFLELDEKASKVVLRLSHIGTDISAALEKLMETKDSLLPPKPVPTPQPIEAEAIYRVGDQDMGHGSSSDQGSSASPLPQSESWAGAGSQSADVSPITESHSVKADPSPGQSEADPTARDGTETSLPKEESSGSGTAHSTDTISLGKYSNKLYEDHPYYVSYDAWIAGGGSEQNYHFRK